MATLIPALSTCVGRMTPGERRFAERLQDKLEDDYLLWYDVAVGPKAFHPDFVILHPSRGLAVLEVKDWRIDTIAAIDKVRATLRTERGEVTNIQPFEQARAYAQAIVDRLQKDPALVGSADAPYPGKLLCPWTYGVVLSNITRSQFEAADLGDVIPESRVICKDEMTEAIEPEAFQSRIWQMFSVTFKCRLSMPQVDRIRYHLFPEIRLDPRQPELFPEDVKIPDIVRIMDLQQEQLARSLGEGHRVIHGVAGSGKTMILGYRCIQLAKAIGKPILVLCYNVALAARLAAFVEDKKLGDKVSVRNFHSWCRAQLELYHVAIPSNGPNFHTECVDAVIRAVERGQIPAGQYGAVLIDEGHDFQPEWLKLVVQMVDPQSNYLLLLYDDAQSLYAPTRRKISFKQLGIQAQGRTTILRLNYRNTAEVLAVAYAFAKEVLSPEDADEDGVPLVEPLTAERHGPKPLLIELPTFNKEIARVIQEFKLLKEQGRSWGDMAIVYRNDFMGDEAEKQLMGAGLPVHRLAGSGRSADSLLADSVKLVTMHSSKGLEFPVVAIPGLGYMPNQKLDEKDETRLLYVGMTRAMDHLIITYHKKSTFVARLTVAGHLTGA